MTKEKPLARRMVISADDMTTIVAMITGGQTEWVATNGVFSIKASEHIRAGGYAVLDEEGEILDVGGSRIDAEHGEDTPAEKKQGDYQGGQEGRAWAHDYVKRCPHGNTKFPASGPFEHGDVVKCDCGRYIRLSQRGKGPDFQVPMHYTDKSLRATLTNKALNEYIEGQQEMSKETEAKGCYFLKDAHERQF